MDTVNTGFESHFQIVVQTAGAIRIAVKQGKMGDCFGNFQVQILFHAELYPSTTAFGHHLDLIQFCVFIRTVCDEHQPISTGKTGIPSSTCTCI